ncbi:hypothetical protein [Streptomyces niveus]|uniref:Uncharacterized protein n=1 Tax=Streptomyces niveus TaxID=193462 RepID=A0ABZ1ZZ96_STRNV|nr:hypothetical protein [Streptomyces niveus]
MKTAVRRWAPYVALSLALALAAGYGWYRMSDTGKGWRYEESLKTFCEGLIPYEESAGFTGKDGELLTRDHRANGYEADYDLCTVAGLDLTIGRIPDSTLNGDSSDVFDRLDEIEGDSPPIPLGGGWRGYTDLVNTAAVLTCDNKPGSVVVTADDDNEAGVSRAHGIAELVTATAVRAAADWDCDAKAGGPIPRLPGAVEWGSRIDAKGTCQGIALRDQEWVEWIKDAPASGTSPLERCVLGELKNGGEPLLNLEAAFGPFAQRLRSDDSDAGTFKRGAGGIEGYYWATAQCPDDGPRAVFRVVPVAYVHIDKAADTFVREALVAFAESRAKQHGCTDLKLPPASS